MVTFIYFLDSFKTLEREPYVDQSTACGFFYLFIFLLAHFYFDIKLGHVI